MDKLLYISANSWGCCNNITLSKVVVGEEEGIIIQEDRLKCMRMYQFSDLNVGDVIDVCLLDENLYSEHECTVTSISEIFVYLRINKDINKGVKNLIKKNYGY